MANISAMNHTVKLDDDDFLCLVDTAGYGIAYWCHKAIVDDSTYTVFFYDDDDKERSCMITAFMLETAWAKILDGEVQVADFIVDYLRSGDLGDVDALAADVLIQTAIFSDIVYG